MSDFISFSPSAFYQALLLAGGFFCTAVGASFFGNAIHWRLKAQRVEGTIIGVRYRGNIYNVYRYILPATGETVEATAGTGTLLKSGHDTGRKVMLHVFPENPMTVKEARSVAGFVLAGVFFLPGLLLLWRAAANYPLTLMTALVIAGAAGYGAFNLLWAAYPSAEPHSVTSLRAQRRSDHEAAMEAVPVRRFEDLDFPSPKETPEQRRSRRRLAPVLLIVGACLIAGFLYTSCKLALLLSNGLRAPGIVWNNELRTGSGKTTPNYHYYAVISFRDHKDTSRSFYDSIGANPPLYEEGEKVTVIYHADDPKDSAIVDRGIFNWIIPALLALTGAIMLHFGRKFYRLDERP